MLTIFDILKKSLKVAKNTSWLIGAKLTSRVLTALFIILLANHLLPRSFGVYNIAISLSYVATVIADFGFDELTIREVSRDKSKAPEMLGNILALRVLLGLLTLSLLYLVYYTIFKELNVKLPVPVLIVAASMILLEKLSGAFIAQFQALQRMEFQAFTTVVSKSVYLALGFIGIYLGFDLFYILLLLFVSYLFNFLISLFVYYSMLNGSIKKPTLNKWPDLVKKASPFTVFIFLSMVYGHVIILLLSIFEGDYSTGVYGASWKIIVFFGVVPYSFGRALYPIFSQHYHSSKKIMKKTYRHSLRYLLVFSLPLTLGLYIIGEDILQFIYRTEFSATVPVFRNIVWMLPFLFMNGSLKMALWGSDKTKDSTKNLALASLVLIVTAIIAIPRLGVVGAAIAVVLAEIVHFMANYRIVTSYLGAIPLTDFWKPYISSVIMAVFLYSNEYIPLTITPLWLLPIAIALYFITLYLLKGIGENDIKMMKELLGMGKKVRP